MFGKDDIIAQFVCHVCWGLALGSWSHVLRISSSFESHELFRRDSFSSLCSSELVLAS